MEFFESLGFACPERKGVADFLQEVTSRKDQKVLLQQLWLSAYLTITGLLLAAFRGCRGGA